jgi:hypothetical protein
MIVCQHEDNLQQFTVIFEDDDINLWRILRERYAGNIEQGLCDVVGCGLYNPLFKKHLNAVLRLIELGSIEGCDFAKIIQKALCHDFECDFETLKSFLEEE